MLKGIKKVCGAIQNATSNHYYLVGSDGKEIWVHDEFVGNGFLQLNADDTNHYEYIYAPLSMKKLNELFS